MTSNPSNRAVRANSILTKSDDEAFRVLLSGLVKPGVDVNIFGRTAPVPAPDEPTLTTITVNVTKENSTVEMWVYNDTQSINYHRAPLSEVVRLYGETVFTDYPTNIQDLFAAYLVKQGFYNRGHEVVNGVVTQDGDVLFTTVGDSFLLTGEQVFKIRQAPKFLADVVKQTTIGLFDPELHMSGDPVALFVAEVNRLNQTTLPRPIVVGEVVMGNPTQTDEHDGLNTEVELIGNNSAVYLDRVILTYHRVNFAYITSGTQLIVTGPANPTTSYLVNKVRDLTGFSIDYDDVVEDTYAELPIGEISTLTLFFHENSLRYVGEITIDYTAE